MNFTNSTHRKRWIFTLEQLAEKRKKNNLASIAAKQKQEAASSSGASASTSGREPLTVEEERQLIKWYLSKIRHVCEQLRLPKRVQAAAQTYLKRYYLLNSCMDHDPQLPALACIYIACKIEEHYMSADELCRQLKLDPQLVLGAELRLLCGLQFDFITHNPYRSLAGLLLDIEQLRRDDPEGELDPALASCSAHAVEKAREEAVKTADALMRMDVPLLFTPGQMAAQCLRVGFARSKVAVEWYLRRVARLAREQLAHGGIGPASDEEAYQQLLAACEAINELGRSEAPALGKEEATAVDKKLKRWLAGSSAVADKASTAAQEERERKRAAKLARRRAEEQAGLDKLLGPMPDLKRPKPEPQG